MPKRMAMLCALTIAVAISARELRGQEPPSPTQPPAAGPAAPGQSQTGPANLSPTRLFFAPTARSLRRGRGSAGVTEIAFPWGEFGVTDRVSVLGFGVLLEGRGIGIAPKIQLYGGAGVQAAVGVAHLFALQGEDSGGIGYGVVTLGSADGGVTAGYGYGYGTLADSGGSPSVFFLGLDKALGRHWRLIAEGYVGGEALGMPHQTIVGGVRFSRGRFSADLGVVVPIYDTGSGTPAPLLTIGWAF
jgi:hypothetical protein